MFQSFVLAIIRLSLNLSSNYTNAGGFGGVGGWGTRSRLYNSGWHSLKHYG